MDVAIIPLRLFTIPFGFITVLPLAFKTDCSIDYLFSIIVNLATYPIAQ